VEKASLLSLYPVSGKALLSLYLVSGKGNDATRNDAVSRHFFFGCMLPSTNKKINSFLKSSQLKVK
jgi:hypothetical protein